MNKEILLDMNELIAPLLSQIEQGAKVSITGYGNSMHPFIENGRDTVILEKIPENKEILEGEIYLYRRANGKYAIHRIFEVNDENISAVGDSQFLVETDIPQKNLVAIVTQVIKGDGTVIRCADPDIIKTNALLMKERIHRYQKKAKIKRITNFPKRITNKCILIFRKNDPYEKKN